MFIIEKEIYLKLNKILLNFLNFIIKLIVF